MAYVKPVIDETGAHIPLYTDIRDEMLARARRVYGEDLYLDPDSQDYQYAAEVSDMLHDAYQFLLQVYNNRSPTTAIGSGLDGVVKTNGIRRKAMTQSMCPVLISGEPGTKIYGGVAADKDQNRWSVGDVIIPESGEISAVAVCQVYGAIYADVGTINKIVTQTRGWIAVTNTVNATPGQLVETDARLRSRQSISTAKPSKTVLQGTIGGVAEIPDVTRYKVYENDTDVFGYYGEPIPGHSICVIAEGGDDQAIGEEIYLRKTPGCGTYGDIEVEITNPELLSYQTERYKQIFGDNWLYIPTTISNPPPVRFFRPLYVDVWVQVRVKMLPGFVSQTITDIRDNICTYLNSLDIGESLTVSALFVPTMQATANITAPTFSVAGIYIGTAEDILGVEDMEIAYNEVTRGELGRILVSIIN